MSNYCLNHRAQQDQPVEKWSRSNTDMMLWGFFCCLDSVSWCVCLILHKVNIMSQHGEDGYDGDGGEIIPRSFVRESHAQARFEAVPFLFSFTSDMVLIIIILLLFFSLTFIYCLVTTKRHGELYVINMPWLILSFWEVRCIDFCCGFLKWHCFICSTRLRKKKTVLSSYGWKSFALRETMINLIPHNY